MARTRNSNKGHAAAGNGRLQTKEHTRSTLSEGSLDTHRRKQHTTQNRMRTPRSATRHSHQTTNKHMGAGAPTRQHWQPTDDRKTRTNQRHTHKHRHVRKPAHNAEKQLAKVRPRSSGHSQKTAANKKTGKKANSRNTKQHGKKATQQRANRKERKHHRVEASLTETCAQEKEHDAPRNKRKRHPQNTHNQHQLQQTQHTPEKREEENSPHNESSMTRERAHRQGNRHGKAQKSSEKIGSTLLRGGKFSSGILSAIVTKP
ncbi:hypothetical protein TRVL_08774 [Trypanosoma vivax]|nr:hypothetical protein TRVL_08774 [Trypanosoma vivax]